MHANTRHFTSFSTTISGDDNFEPSQQSRIKNRLQSRALKCTFVSPISTLKATKGVNSHAQMGCFPKFRPYHTISSHQKVRRGVNSHVLMGCFPNFDVWKLSVSHLFLRMLTLFYSLVPSESIPTQLFPNSTSDSFHQ